MDNLQKQVHIYSLTTDSFFNDDEQEIHKNLMRLYRCRDHLKSLDVDCRKRKKFIKRKIDELKSDLYDKFDEFSGIRELRDETLKPKRVISLFDSVLTRTIGINEGELSEDLIVVESFHDSVLKDIVMNGFVHNGQMYIYYSSSAGQIRQKKSVFIRKSVWNQCEDALTCGLSVDDINSQDGININKYQAYMALSNSASVEWSGFDIDKAIVVDDLETNVFAEVDYIDRDTYEIERKEMDIPIEHTDGCGMVLPCVSDKAFMVRSVWIKGLLVPFPFDKFANEHDSYIVKDIYGKEHDIRNVEVVFTKSQFKTWKYYRDWQDYKDKFKKHKCQASYMNVEEPSRNTKINYQILQTLTDVTDDELKKIAHETAQDIENVGSDRETMLRILDADESNIHKNSFQKALSLYPELLNDVHAKEVIKDKKKSLVKEAKSGRLNIDGKYIYIIPDLYAFCERLFLGVENPKGLLENGEVYCGLFDGGKVDVLRSPHLYREHAIKNNVIDDKKGKWFVTGGVYTSVHDPISKLLQFDNDGDKVWVIPDKTFVNVAERNMKGIVPLYYEMAKAEAQEINRQNLYDSLILAYRANIGQISNEIMKIWNSDRIDLDAIKWLCMENNFEIDYAKTLFKPIRPDHVADKLKAYAKGKVPHFFRYAKNRKKKNVEEINDSTVNRLSNDDIIKIKRINFQKVAGKFDYHNLMKNKRVKLDDEIAIEIIDTYTKLDQSKRWMMNGQKDMKRNSQSYVYKLIRKELLNISGNAEYVTDVLVKHLYQDKNSKHKMTLWKCFGDELVRNIMWNVHGIIECKDCGTVVDNFERRKARCVDCEYKWKLKKDNERRKNKKNPTIRVS